MNKKEKYMWRPRVRECYYCGREMHERGMGHKPFDENAHRFYYCEYEKCDMFLMYQFPKEDLSSWKV